MPTIRSPGTVDLDRVRAVFETNVFGVIAVTNAMLPLLRRSPAPRIVNVSSYAASLSVTSDPDGPFATLLPAASSPSNTALIALTVQYANELRKDGMLIDAVAPGYVDTDSNNHRGFLTVAQGASVLVRLATLGADGPTAGFFSEESSVPALVMAAWLIPGDVLSGVAVRPTEPWPVEHVAPVVRVQPSDDVAPEE